MRSFSSSGAPHTSTAAHPSTMASVTPPNPPPLPTTSTFPNARARQPHAAPHPLSIPTHTVAAMAPAVAAVVASVAAVVASVMTMVLSLKPLKSSPLRTSKMLETLKLRHNQERIQEAGAYTRSHFHST